MLVTDRKDRLDDGSIIADARITRAGVFLYEEPGAPGGVLRVFRPPEEVFKQKSLDTLRLVPLTREHPVARVVDADNWNDSNIIGAVGTDITRDDVHVVASVAVRERTSLTEFDGGVRELSAGFRADRVYSVEGVDDDGRPYSYTAPGVWTHNGVDYPYDMLHANIVYNHVAHVKHGRAGTARFLDSANSETLMITTDSKPERQEVDGGASGADKRQESDAKDGDVSRVTDADEMVEIELGGFSFEVSAGLAAAINMLKEAAGMKEAAPPPEPEPEPPRPEELAAPEGDSVKKLTDENSALRQELDTLRDRVVVDSIGPTLDAAGLARPKGRDGLLTAVKAAIGTKLPAVNLDHLDSVDAAMGVWRTVAGVPVVDSALTLNKPREADPRRAADDAWKNGAPALTR